MRLTAYALVLVYNLGVDLSCLDIGVAKKFVEDAGIVGSMDDFFLKTRRG